MALNKMFSLNRRAACLLMPRQSLRSVKFISRAFAIARVPPSPILQQHMKQMLRVDFGLLAPQESWPHRAYRHHQQTPLNFNIFCRDHASRSDLLNCTLRSLLWSRRTRVRARAHSGVA
eukprot:1296937-Pleurochrysis_carterae.AAC.5